MRLREEELPQLKSSSQLFCGGFAESEQDSGHHEVCALLSARDCAV